MYACRVFMRFLCVWCHWLRRLAFAINHVESRSYERRTARSGAFGWVMFIYARTSRTSGVWLCALCVGIVAGAERATVWRRESDKQCRRRCWTLRTLPCRDCCGSHRNSTVFIYPGSRVENASHSLLKASKLVWCGLMWWNSYCDILR